jgi:hypothetical protein
VHLILTAAPRDSSARDQLPVRSQEFLGEILLQVEILCGFRLVDFVKNKRIRIVLPRGDVKSFHPRLRPNQRQIFSANRKLPAQGRTSVKVLFCAVSIHKETLADISASYSAVLPGHSGNT